MKSICTFLLALASIFLLSCGSSKTTTSDHDSSELMNNASLEQAAEGQTAQMTERLNLTSEQSVAVNAINIEYAEKLEGVKKQPRSMNKMNAFKSMQKDKAAEMKKVLSSEQFVVYEEMTEEMMNEMKRKRRGR